jgi:hypothetical protein
VVDAAASAVAGVDRLRHPRHCAFGRAAFCRRLVIGDDLESAERRFFDAWVNKTWVNKSWTDPSAADGAPRASSPAMGVAMARRPSSEVIGLFPQPGAPR